jgi:hypothetical protein
MTREQIRPLLFLDIDGVLNSVQFYVKHKKLHAARGQGLYSMDPACVNRVEQICDEARCDIVIMSTWRRIHSISDIARYFMLTGYGKVPPIVGATPVLSSLRHEQQRGSEVDAYLFTKMPISYVGKFVCLDDHHGFYSHQPFVFIDSETGLTDQDVEKAVLLLKTRTA